MKPRPLTGPTRSPITWSAQTSQRTSSHPTFLLTHQDRPLPHAWLHDCSLWALLMLLPLPGASSRPTFLISFKFTSSREPSLTSPAGPGTPVLVPSHFQPPGGSTGLFQSFCSADRTAGTNLSANSQFNDPGWGSNAALRLVFFIWKMEVKCSLLHKIIVWTI